jgi:DNA-binding NtrC family response regulator
MQKKVLLVNQQGSELSELVRLQGYFVDEAKSVQKALKAILDGNYALVISDLSVAGLETLDNVKAFCPGIPVVLTSDEHILTQREAIELGAHDLIEKSALVDEQLRRIQTILNQPMHSVAEPKIGRKAA